MIQPQSSYLELNQNSSWQSCAEGLEALKSWFYYFGFRGSFRERFVDHL